jgi:ATP-binding cassette subfamily B protein
MVTMMPAMMLIMNLTSLAIVWVGAYQIADSTMQIGDMMAFMQYSMQIIMSFLMIAMMFILVPRAAVSAKRIEEVLETESTVQDPKAPVSFLPEQTGVVEFKDVSFHYEGADRDVLSHITFTAEPGKTTAFIGSTGSGKSTLVNLIPRFYDCTEGQILVNGVDVKDVCQHDLRERIGYVPQKGILHKGTIASNIGYGAPNATEEDLTAAAEVAQAMDFIRQKENGMESEIAAGGTNVSGGQRQRLSIARALAKHPDIYIFDDSFSALDFKTDAALRRALHSYTDRATVLIVAQRVGTILNADQILVLDEGKIVGRGTHKELLQTCPVYYEIASSQLTKEELA